MTDDEIGRVAAVTAAVLNDPIPIGTIAHMVRLGNPPTNGAVLVELQIKVGPDEWVALNEVTDEQDRRLRALGIYPPFNSWGASSG